MEGRCVATEMLSGLESIDSVASTLLFSELTTNVVAVGNDGAGHFSSSFFSIDIEPFDNDFSSIPNAFAVVDNVVVGVVVVAGTTAPFAVSIKLVFRFKIETGLIFSNASVKSKVLDCKEPRATNLSRLLFAGCCGCFCELTISGEMPFFEVFAILLSLSFDFFEKPENGTLFMRVLSLLPRPAEFLEPICKSPTSSSSDMLNN